MLKGSRTNLINQTRIIGLYSGQAEIFLSHSYTYCFLHVNSFFVPCLFGTWTFIILHKFLSFVGFIKFAFSLYLSLSVLTSIEKTLIFLVRLRSFQQTLIHIYITSLSRLLAFSHCPSCVQHVLEVSVFPILLSSLPILENSAVFFLILSITDS